MAQADEFGERDPVQASLLQSLQAYAAYKMGDYETAHSIWLPLAESGNTTAMVNLANLYLQGQGMAEDRSQAQYWLDRADALGDERATEILQSIDSE